MSLLFMLSALVGTVLVLAGGSYALRWIIASITERLTPAEAPSESVDPVPEAQVGGYVPAPRPPGELPSELRARVRNLVALGRAEEAVRLVRDRVDGDEERARGIVARLGGDDTGTPTLER
ncbi:hypothetical protein [Nocardiopsis lambiniae]|uniref:Uncharacterized protein n=1 Tax=Nocardiopsis lambiniae TaxID=3075539 RepID=A0ABU2M4C1_9ACTN|nr:hypothetical protein [Nocardiopsis sp. DSM 44743]MDT0327161.1 hypothetical protein [Nocardiopsis sp. DSM 44743]